jgi:hypothetical protein
MVRISPAGYSDSSWMPISLGLIAEDNLHQHILTMLRHIASCLVANRPGRLEPRVLKRRRHGYKLMRKPRAVLRAELRKHCTYNNAWGHDRAIRTRDLLTDQTLSGRATCPNCKSRRDTHLFLNSEYSTKTASGANATQSNAPKAKMAHR